MNNIKIGSSAVGNGEPCFVIAEMGLGHDGSLGAAQAFIDSAAECGADAVKFQTHIAEEEGTGEERFRVNVFPQDKTRGNYWKRTAFTEEEWLYLKRRADEKDVIFLSSPFSEAAADLLTRIGMPAWKIASGETANLPLLEKLARTGLPVLLSTGMSKLGEIDRSVELLRESKAPFAVFQCTNRYPCPPEHLGLNMISEFKDRFGVPVGFSDHSGRPCSGIAAFLKGACAIEVHVTFSKRCFGPDVAASLTFEQLKCMIEDIRYLETALAASFSKDGEADDLKETRSLFMKSIVAARDLETGRIIELEDMAFKKPGTGMPAGAFKNVVGKKLKRALKKDEMLSLDDIE